MTSQCHPNWDLFSPEFKSFLKNGSNPAFFVYFLPFLNVQTILSKIWLLKHRWSAWDSNLWPQYGRRSRINWAMASPWVRKLFVNKSFVSSFRKSLTSKWHITIWPRRRQQITIKLWSNFSQNLPFPDRTGCVTEKLWFTIAYAWTI